MRALLISVCLLSMLSGCSYLSSNIVKLRGDEIQGSFMGSPVNITGKGVVITVYREMIVTWKKLRPEFSNRLQVVDDKEKGDILMEKVK